MKTRFSLFTLAAAAVTALYLLIPACGNRDGNNNNNPAFQPGFGNCQPGQFCQGGVGGFGGGVGVPLVPGPVIARIDNYGSTVQINIGGTSVVAGQVYSGGSSITGVINFMPGGRCPPGAYNFQGQGNWTANFGGSVGKIEAQFMITGGPIGQMQGYVNGLVFQGQLPSSNIATTFYLTGLFQTSCDPTGVAK